MTSTTATSNRVVSFDLNLDADRLPTGVKIAFRLTASYTFGGKSDIMTKDVEVEVLPVPAVGAVKVYHGVAGERERA